MKPIHLMTGCLFCAVTVEAQDAAFQASLTPEVAIYSKSTEVQGLSLSIWGENPQHGVAFGFVNGSTGDSRGFSLGLVNYTEMENDPEHHRGKLPRRVEMRNFRFSWLGASKVREI